jgi:hypothetical protein
VDAYNIVRKDRNDKRGGGVCLLFILYIRQSIKYHVLYMSNLLFDNKQEFIFIEILLNSSRLLCPLVYRRPNGESVECYLLELANLLPAYKQICILGDININLNVNSKAERRLILVLWILICLLLLFLIHIMLAHPELQLM